MGTVKNIQALRGVAALLVVFEHLEFVRHSINPGAPGGGQFPFRGAMGVDIFFVISGYVITLTAVRREHDSFGFFFARLARVCPLYLVLTLLRAAFKHYSLGSIWNGLFYLPLFDEKSYTPPPVFVGWTLSFEMWFYTVFALLLAFFPPRRVAVLLPSLFCIGAGLMTFYRGEWYFPRFMFHPFVIEFAFGCLIFTVQSFISRRAATLLAGLGVLFLLCFGFWYPPSIEQFPVVLNSRLDLAWWRVLIWGLPAALLVAGCVGIEKSGGWTFPCWLVGMGTISYSLYLVHTFTPGVVARGLILAGCRNSTVAGIAMIVFAIALAYACWRWIERPLTLCAQAWVAKRYHVPIREVVPAKIAEPATATV